MSAPQDPLFYRDLDAMAQRVGAKSEDLLLVWSSESDLRSDLAGNSRTFSTLMHYIAVPSVMSEEEWQKLPTMTARAQLPYVEKAIYAPAHRALGRSFRNTFETYLANAASGMLRPSGGYSQASVMYAGSNYPDNWPMDNAPAGVLAAQKAGVRITSPRATYEFAKDLVSSGALKGYVSLGDLEVFGKRLLGSASVAGSTFQSALTNLHAVRASLIAGEAPSIGGPMSDFLAWRPVSYQPGDASSAAGGYVPDFDSAFPAGAPRDDRVATPQKARAKMPAHAGGSAPNSISWGTIALGGVTAIGVAIVLNRK